MRARETSTIAREIEELQLQKEICRMVTDGTLDGTDYCSKIYNFVLSKYIRAGGHRRGVN